MLIHRSTTGIYEFLMVSSADFVTPITGIVPTIKIGKAGAALAVATNPPVERGVGWYEVTYTALETDTIGPLRFDIAGAGAAPWRDITQIYISLTAGNGAIAFTYTLTDSVTTLPLAGANVWATTDLAGANIAASGVTDAFGQVVFYLDAGTYYFWRALAGYSFVNPDTEVVS